MQKKLFDAVITLLVSETDTFHSVPETNLSSILSLYIAAVLSTLKDRRPDSR